MENNIIKENQLDVLPKKKAIIAVEENKLPVLKEKKQLLPAVIKKRELALIEIKKEFNKVKKNHSLSGIARFLKNVLILFAKLIRYTFLASSKTVCFVIFSSIVILSTTIITKNVVNSLCGVKATQDQTTYSIYSIKDDDEAKAKAETEQQEQDNLENSNEENNTEDNGNN